MADSTVHRLVNMTSLLRDLEHHLSEESRKLLREFDSEYRQFSGSDIASKEAAKIRKYLAKWKSDLESARYKAAGKDLEKVMDEIVYLEKQLGKKH